MQGSQVDHISFLVLFMLQIITGPLYSIEQINDSLGTDLCQDDADKAWYSLGLVIGQVQGLRLLPSKKRRIEATETLGGDLDTWRLPSHHDSGTYFDTSSPRPSYVDDKGSQIGTGA